LSAALPELSVLIPAYNEEARLGPTLDGVARCLQADGLSAEILVVDDGSRDATADVATGFATPPGVELRLLKLDQNRGKGAAVRLGARQARGRLVLLSDADLSTPIEEWRKLESALAGGFDIAIGSRGLADSQIELHQPFYRESMGKIFNLLVRSLGLSEFRDTQCGFKLFTHEAARTSLAKLSLERFAFDVEALLIAQRSGLRVVEVPIVWRDSRGSRVRPGADSLRMALDLLRLKLRDLGGRIPA
jgi:dolichyl-phosphate beta-glucosyltransferase